MEDINSTFFIVELRQYFSQRIVYFSLFNQILYRIHLQKKYFRNFVHCEYCTNLFVIF